MTLRAVMSAALVLAVGGCGGSSSSAREDVERALGDADFTFTQLLAATDIRCKAGASRDGASKYDCIWLQEDTEQKGRFVLSSDEPARVSDGGEEPSSPADEREAARRVDAVYRERTGETDVPPTVCVPKPTDTSASGQSVELGPNSYECGTQGPAGWVTVRWAWNHDGTVRREALLDAAAALPPQQEAFQYGTQDAGASPSVEAEEPTQPLDTQDASPLDSVSAEDWKGLSDSARENAIGRVQSDLDGGCNNEAPAAIARRVSNWYDAFGTDRSVGGVLADICG